MSVVLAGLGGSFLSQSHAICASDSCLRASISAFKTTENPNEVVSAIKIILMMTVLTLAPAILIMMTGFTRIIIVLSFLRQALGTAQMPPNQLLVGLALFLTFFVMRPAFDDINNKSLRPYLAGTISQEKALDEALIPLRKFMFNQTRDSDLALFVKLSKMEQPKTRADVPDDDARSFFRHFRIEDRVSNRLHHLLAVSRDRHGRLGGVDGDGHDDASAGRHLASI